MGWIAWEPARSRLRPSESVPANGRPADQMPWPGWVLQPSGSAAKASTKSGGSRGPRKRNRQATGDAQAGSRSAFIVPLTAGNWAHRDPREGRGAPRDENRCRETREETLGSANLSTKRQRISELARTKAGTALSTLHHVIDLEWMREAYRLTRKDGASGIDGVTAPQYEANLEANLSALLERIKSGRHVAPPVRRAYIPKADGSERPLGIPTFEADVRHASIAAMTLR